MDFISISLLFLTILFAIGFIVMLILYFTIRCNNTNGEMNNTNADEQMNLLWRDHVSLTRMFLMDSLLHNNKAALDETTKQLLQNQDKLGANYARIYGNKQLGNEYAKLLKEHILIAAEIVQNAKNNKPNDEAIKKWYKNKDELVQFISTYNKNIDPQILNKHYTDHLDLTTQELLHMLKGNYPASFDYYNRALASALQMSQYIGSKSYNNNYSEN